MNKAIYLLLALLVAVGVLVMLDWGMRDQSQSRQNDLRNRLQAMEKEAPVNLQHDAAELRLAHERVMEKERSRFTNTLIELQGGSVAAAVMRPGQSVSEAILNATAACLEIEAHVRVEVARHTEFTLTVDFLDSQEPRELAATPLCFLPFVARHLSRIMLGREGRYWLELGRAELEQIEDWKPDESPARLRELLRQAERRGKEMKLSGTLLVSGFDMKRATQRDEAPLIKLQSSVEAKLVDRLNSGRSNLLGAIRQIANAGDLKDRPSRTELLQRMSQVQAAEGSLFGWAATFRDALRAHEAELLAARLIPEYINADLRSWQERLGDSGSQVDAILLAARQLSGVTTAYLRFLTTEGHRWNYGAGPRSVTFSDQTAKDSFEAHQRAIELQDSVLGAALKAWIPVN